MKMNVLFIVPSLRLGGAERQIVDVANGLAEKDIRIHFFTFEDDLSLAKTLKSDKMTFYNYPRKYRYDLSPCKEIAKIIKQNRIDIIHCTVQFAFFYGFLGRLLSGNKPKLICSVHTTINRNLKYELFDRLLYVPLMRRCDRIITVCENQNRYWSAKYAFLKKKIVTIHNGIDTELYADTMPDEEKRALREVLGILDGEIVIGMVAGLRMEKGHEYAFKAIELLLKSDERVKLVLVGDGPRSSFLHSLAKELGVFSKIVWAGKIKDPRRHISIFDIFLMSSYTVETFSIAILEALSMGKPVVATDIGGTAEMVENGINGYLVPPKNPGALAEKLHALARNPELRAQMARQARKKVEEKFMVSMMVDRTEKLLKRMVS